MFRHYPEGGPDTTNLKYGVESAILSCGVDPTKEMIDTLDEYFRCVAFGDVEMSKLFEGRIQFSALEANTRFE